MPKRFRPALVYALVSVAGLVLIPDSVRSQEAMPLSLEQGIELALQNNEILRMAQADLEKSRQQVREAAADALPQIDASAEYTRNWKLPTTVFETPGGRQEVSIGTKNNFQGAVTLRQTLFSWGKVGSALKVARLFRVYSEEGLRLVRQNVRSDVERAYYSLVLADDLVKVSRLAMQRAHENQRRVRRLREAGRVSGYDLLRAEVQVSTLRPDSIQAENTRTLAELDLKNTVGIDPDRKIEVSGRFRNDTDLDVSTVDDLIQLGLERRPEMRQLTRQIQMRRHAIRIAQAASRPSLDLLALGRVTMQSNEFELNTDEAKKSWLTGVTLSIPLFDGMRTRSQVLQARAELRKSDLQLRNAERNTSLQIRQAWLDLKVAKERLEAQEMALGQARRGLEIAQSRYANGVGTQLELLDAELVLLNSETNFAQEKRNQAAALVTLEQAVGVLGEPIEEPSEEAE